MEYRLHGGIGQFPNVRLPGPLKCCLEAIEASGRLTMPGAQLRCFRCRALLVVDEMGAWTLTA